MNERNPIARFTGTLRIIAAGVAVGAAAVTEWVHAQPVPRAYYLVAAAAVVACVLVDLCVARDRRRARRSVGLTAMVLTMLCTLHLVL